ncbi:MAG: hypothetical protein MUO60_17000, partial [Clostridiaceae bacterium]|nr:hypothetical protein [Clostridiaceae bacterium]
NKILDKRMEIINQLVDFKISQDIKEISKRFDVLTKEIYDELFKRAKQLINSQIDNLKLEMGKFCRRFPNPDSYLTLINSRVTEEKNKLMSNVKREVDIFQKQFESNVQGRKISNEIIITEQERQLPSLDAWNKIKNEFDVSKHSFGRKIDFIKDEFKRKIIFRDISNTYMLVEKGFNKSAVILAGSIIEELLRLYLEYKNIHPLKDKFDEYIKSCENERILKKGISRLSDSVRCFRNIVHLENEKSSKYTISKAAAKNALSSIFIIINDF